MPTPIGSNNLLHLIIQRQRGLIKPETLRSTLERVNLSRAVNRIKLAMRALWVITPSGKLYSKLNKNRYFQLQLTDTAQWPGFSGNIVQVDGDEDHSCLFLTDSGQVYSRGLNNFNQLGLMTISGSCVESFTKLCPEKNFYRFSGKIIQLQVLNYYTYFLTDTQKLYRCGLDLNGSMISPECIGFEDFSKQIPGKIVYFNVSESTTSDYIFLTNLGEVWIKDEINVHCLADYESLRSQGLMGAITQIVIGSKVQLLTASGQLWESNYVLNSYLPSKGFTLINRDKLVSAWRSEKICFISPFGDLHSGTSIHCQLLVNESGQLKILDKNFQTIDLELPMLTGEIITANGSHNRRVFITANNEVWCAGNWFDFFNDEAAYSCHTNFKKIPLVE